MVKFILRTFLLLLCEACKQGFFNLPFGLYKLPRHQADLLLLFPSTTLWFVIQTLFNNFALFWWLITLRVTQPKRPRSHTYGEAFNHSEEVLESYFFFHLLHLNMVFTIWSILYMEDIFYRCFLYKHVFMVELSTLVDQPMESFYSFLILLWKDLLQVIFLGGYFFIILGGRLVSFAFARASLVDSTPIYGFFGHPLWTLTQTLKDSFHFRIDIGPSIWSWRGGVGKLFWSSHIWMAYWMVFPFGPFPSLRLPLLSTLPRKGASSKGPHSLALPQLISTVHLA